MKRNTQSTLPNARSGLVLAVTAAVVFTLALSGCSKPADTSSPPKAAAPTTEAPAPGAPQAAAPQTAAQKPAAVPQAAAKPAAPQASATPAAGNDAAAMKRLIEEKMKQLQSGAARPGAELAACQATCATAGRASATCAAASRAGKRAPETRGA
jgi:hypothetical protein